MQTVTLRSMLAYLLLFETSFHSGSDRNVCPSIGPAYTNIVYAHRAHEILC